MLVTSIRSVKTLQSTREVPSNRLHYTHMTGSAGDGTPLSSGTFSLSLVFNLTESSLLTVQKTLLKQNKGLWKSLVSCGSISIRRQLVRWAYLFRQPPDGVRRGLQGTPKLSCLTGTFSNPHINSTLPTYGQLILESRKTVQ